MNLDKLLKPKSMAVIGASERDGFGGDVCRNILGYMDNLDRVYFVHPKRDSVFGHKCYPSVEAIDDTIDLAVICTSKKIAPLNLREVHAKGCRDVVLYASGYRETQKEEDKQDERDLVALCSELGMNLMGPNCGGFANFIDNVQAFAFVVGERNRKGNIGLLSQSGQVCVVLMDSPVMNYSYIISAGNSSVVRMEDYIDFLVDDPDTKVVSIYLEGVQKPAQFVNSLKRAAEKRKPVVILKTGRSEKGRQVASSHTGSLAGSDKTYDAIFKKFGVIRVNDMVELIAVSNLLATLHELPAGPNLAAMNISGGETGISADVGSLYGLSFPDFTPRTTAALKELLPGFATVNNPLDMTASLAYDTENLTKAMEAIMDEEHIDMLVMGMTIPVVVSDPANEIMTRACELVREHGYKKPIVAVPSTEDTRNPDYLARLHACGIPILPPVTYASRILSYLADFITYDYSAISPETAVPDADGSGQSTVLSEHESKLMLKKAGISVDPGVIAKTADEAASWAKNNGYPVVMKIESRDIPHKSEAGGVFLNIRDEAGVRETFAKLIANAEAYKADARINGVLMQNMMPSGVEVILGVNNDPQFGPMLMVGLGGVFVEVFKDVALYPAPVNKAEAMSMLKGLRAYKLLTGYRGAKPCDLEALTDCMVAVSRFAAENKNNLKELDINPLFVYEQGKGFGIADALIITK